MAENSIGDFEFLDIMGQVPDVAKEQLRVESRPGVDGNFILQTGQRGRQFTVRTAVDAADLTAALLLFNGYTALIADEPQELTWHGQNLSAGNQLYQVLDVRAIEIRELAANAIGGLNPPSEAICECEWDLLPVVVSS